MKVRKLPTPIGEPVALQPPEPRPFPGVSLGPNDDPDIESFATEAERERQPKPWYPSYLWMECSLRKEPDNGWKYGL